MISTVQIFNEDEEDDEERCRLLTNAGMDILVYTLLVIDFKLFQKYFLGVGKIQRCHYYDTVLSQWKS